MMNPASLDSLAMSRTKEDLLKHLNMDLNTYSLMANEAGRVYKWLTSDERHLKKNCRRKPPYDWSDILEKSKDEAMARIVQAANAHTSYYWSLAAPTQDCPNWIAKWFLYHKFRYRDGRNRNPTKGNSRDDSQQTSRNFSSRSKHTYADSSDGSQTFEQRNGPEPSNSRGEEYSTKPRNLVSTILAILGVRVCIYRGLDSVRQLCRISSEHDISGRRCLLICVLVCTSRRWPDYQNQKALLRPSPRCLESLPGLRELFQPSYVVFGFNF